LLHDEGIETSIATAKMNLILMVGRCPLGAGQTNETMFKTG
jgi:hypothetical protein